jgi:hypothetical protein
MHHTAEITARRVTRARLSGRQSEEECGSLFVLAKSERKQGALEAVEATMFGVMVIRIGGIDAPALGAISA